MPSAHIQDAERLSRLIGDIYDCVLDPTHWDETLDDVRALLDCANAILYVAELPSQQHRLEKMVGVDRHWAERLSRHVPDVAALHSLVEDFYTRPLDEPFVCSRDVPGPAWHANGYFLGWAQPQGIIDVIDTILIRRPNRVASCALGRHEHFGPIGEREVQLTRLLAPHLRRAVTISDLIDMKSFAAEALGSTLDALTVGVVLVDEGSAILHANCVAARMLEQDGPITVAGGRLQAAQPAATERLRRAIAIATRDETRIGAAGIGLALTERSGEIATAHVLPLARRSLRPRLETPAVAAVFVAPGASTPVAELTAVAEGFGLTPSEMRVLERLVFGDSITGAAEALGIATTTAKTHLARILAKTGARRQTTLLTLVNRLVPAVSAGESARESNESVAEVEFSERRIRRMRRA